CNRALADLWGRPPREITGRPYPVLVQELFGQVEVPSFGRVQQGGLREEAEQASGGRWFRVTAASVVGETGVAGTLHVWADVTGRKQVERAARAELAFRRAAEDAVLGGIAAVDREGRQTYVNPAFCKMVGWDAAELLGAEPPFIYWPPDEVKAI